MPWWIWPFIGLAVLVASWTLLVLLATRLPEGSLKELAGFLPDCATTARRLRRDPRVPRRAKFAIGFALLWVLSPIDVIPEFLPVIGPLDDVVVVARVPLRGPSGAAFGPSGSLAGKAIDDRAGSRRGSTKARSCSERLRRARSHPRLARYGAVGAGPGLLFCARVCVIETVIEPCWRLFAVVADHGG